MSHILLISHTLSNTKYYVFIINICYNFVKEINATKEIAMKRTTMLKILNPILGLLLVNQIVTGLLNDSLSHETFETLHETGGIVLAMAVALHVALNWNWIKANFFKRGPAAKI